jgi:hypothetical protein
VVVQGTTPTQASLTVPIRAHSVDVAHRWDGHKGPSLVCVVHPAIDRRAEEEEKDKEWTKGARSCGGCVEWARREENQELDEELGA